MNHAQQLGKNLQTGISVANEIGAAPDGALKTALLRVDFVLTRSFDRFYDARRDLERTARGKEKAGLIPSDIRPLLIDFKSRVAALLAKVRGVAIQRQERAASPEMQQYGSYESILTTIEDAGFNFETPVYRVFGVLARNADEKPGAKLTPRDIAAKLAGSKIKPLEIINALESIQGLLPTSVQLKREVGGGLATYHLTGIEKGGEPTLFTDEAPKGEKIEAVVEKIKKFRRLISEITEGLNHLAQMGAAGACPEPEEEPVPPREIIMVPASPRFNEEPKETPEQKKEREEREERRLRDERSIALASTWLQEGAQKTEPEPPELEPKPVLYSPKEFVKKVAPLKTGANDFLAVGNLGGAGGNLAKSGARSSDNIFGLTYKPSHKPPSTSTSAPKTRFFLPAKERKNNPIEFDEKKIVRLEDHRIIRRIRPGHATSETQKMYKDDLLAIIGKDHPRFSELNLRFAKEKERELMRSERILEVLTRPNTFIVLQQSILEPIPPEEYMKRKAPSNGVRKKPVP